MDGAVGWKAGRYAERNLWRERERGTMSWVLSLEEVTEMQRSKAEIRECGGAAASVHGRKPTLNADTNVVPPTSIFIFRR
jgi:hypothetical protein